MKIAFPTNGENLDSELFFHFGLSSKYLIYDTETKESKLIKNTSEHMGGSGFPPELIKKNGVNIMIVSDLGQRALKRFNQSNIEVYCKAEGKIRDILVNFEKGKLEKANVEIICKGH